MGTNTSYLPALDGLRGYAFLFVLVAHMSQFITYGFKSSGKEGLILFFVLSAFLLTRNLVFDIEQGKTKRLWSRYALRRFLRIYPMYTFILLVLLFIKLPVIFNIDSVIQHLFLFSGEFHLWSVPVEIKYYIILPFVVLVFIHLFKKKVILFFLVTAVVVLLYPFAYPTIKFFVDNGLPNEISIWLYLPTFLIGSAFAIVTTQSNVLVQMIIRYKNVLIITCMIMVLVLLPISYDAFLVARYDHLFYTLLLYYTIPFAIITTVLSTTHTFVSALFTNKVISYIGKISFSGYLIHYILLTVFRVYGIPLTPVLGSIAIVTLTFGLASLTYYLIERPCIRLSHRW